MTVVGHQLEITRTHDHRELSLPVRTVEFECDGCELRGAITAPPDVADATVADLYATHWGATGGDAHWGDAK